MDAVPDRPLQIDLQRDGKVVVLTVAGSLDSIDLETVREKLEKLCAADGPCVVIDLSAMDFISPSALGMLVGEQSLARGHKGRISLVNPCPEIRRMLQTTRLDEVFAIYDSVEAAKTSGL
jgi:anti-sigma B factor antagonist